MVSYKVDCVYVGDLNKDKDDNMDTFDPMKNYNHIKVSEEGDMSLTLEEKQQMAEEYLQKTANFKGYDEYNLWEIKHRSEPIRRAAQVLLGADVEPHPAWTEREVTLEDLRDVIDRVDAIQLSSDSNSVDPFIGVEIYSEVNIDRRCDVGAKIETKCMEKIPRFNMNIQSICCVIEDHTSVKSIQVTEKLSERFEFTVPDKQIFDL